jgi:hypothetical protein
MLHTFGDVMRVCLWRVSSEARLDKNVTERYPWAVLTMWHAFLFLGLGFFFSFLLLAWWPPLLFLVKQFLIYIIVYRVVP